MTRLTRLLARLLAVAVATGALAAPPASARPADDRPTAISNASLPSETEPASTPPVVRELDAGFDWGSAAVGAGSGAALVLLALGGLTAARGGSPRLAR